MDPANPVILYDVEMDGELRKGIGQLENRLGIFPRRDGWLTISWN